MSDTIYLFFLFAISIHNIEEAIWLPKWSKYASRFHKEVKPYEFHFAVIIVTVFAYLFTALFFMFQDSFVLKYLYFGFLGAMVINVFFPHLVATIVIKRYTPGLITGFTLVLPISSLIIYFALKYHVIDWIMLVISTVFVGVLLLLSLRPLFKLGEFIKEYHWCIK